jgi:tetratricopeptide (TPR) repeat protein
MKILQILGCLLSLGFGVVQASEVSAFDAANEKFTAGDYAGAVAAYEALLEAEGPSVAVLYNLGNSYQKLGELGPAILVYERARMVRPRDGDVVANLALARKQAALADEQAQASWVEVFFQHLSRHEWACLVAGAALVIGVGSLVAAGVRVWSRALRGSFLAGLSVAVLLMGSGAAALYLRRGEADLGIVLAAEAAVRLSPFGSAESLGSPGAGRKVRLGQKSGDFQFVEVPGTSLQGWVSAKEVARILTNED